MKKKRKAKRSGVRLTRSFCKNRKACKTQAVVSGHLHGDHNRDVWTDLSDEQKSYLSKSVASITLYNAIDRQGNHLTRFLTSASLVKALNYTTNKDHNDLKIKVCHEGKEVYKGYLAEFDLDHKFAVVNVRTFLDVHVGLQHVLGIPPEGVSLVAVGRDIYGKLMARIVKLSGDLRVCEDDEDLDSNTNLKAWEGGPLFSFDGNFVGMSLFLTMRRAFFLPWGSIFEHLERQISLAQSESLNVQRFGERLGERSISHLEKISTRNNWILTPWVILSCHQQCYVTLLATYVVKVSGENSVKKASSDLNRSVVALASFNGDKRFFACMGFFIEWNGSTFILTSASLVRKSGEENKIVENLRIEVLLPHGQCREGELKHCNLHYNVALVGVTNCHARRAKTLLHWTNMHEVAAVGRCFNSGTLMAKAGELVPWSGTLDCDFLFRSSCEITKAGIGGPLVTLDGDVIGMKFYDTKIQTPFLSWECICHILALFEGKSKVGEVGNDSDPLLRKMAGDDKNMINKWPVPMPCWRPLGSGDEDMSDDDDDFKYCYENGEKLELY
ncbi:unnamed protein product [Urochloa decumbens]|uniref:Uncharacterized protein n=1 Tax=Urochloa decumbens TaxID=240449 RepID=A0ABC8W3K5_9POAL